jgi:hypothetical protein
MAVLALLRVDDKGVGYIPMHACIARPVNFTNAVIPRI